MGTGRKFARGIARHFWFYIVQGVIAVASLLSGIYNAYKPSDWPSVSLSLEWLVILTLLGVLVAAFLTYRDLDREMTGTSGWSPFAFYRQVLNEVITARNQHLGNALDLAQEHARIVQKIKTTLELRRAEEDLARFDNLGYPRYVQGGYDHTSPANLYQSFLIELEGRVEELRNLHDPAKRGVR